MKRIAMWAVLGLAVAGCIVPSVYPFYMDKDVVFKPELTGTWRDAKSDGNDKETWVFSKEGDSAYKFAINKETATKVMTAHLFKLKDHLFMDCLCVASDGMDIPPHYLLKVEQIRPTLKMTTLNVDWLQEYLEKNPDALRHTLAPSQPASSDLHVVLTADTKDLQKFILKHLDEDKVFAPVDEMKPVETK